VRIRRGTGDDPVLITSREPFEFTAPVLKEQADVILMQVRTCAACWPVRTPVAPSCRRQTAKQRCLGASNPHEDR
jgi:hypothetical protein